MPETVLLPFRGKEVAKDETEKEFASKTLSALEGVRVAQCAQLTVNQGDIVKVTSAFGQAGGKQDIGTVGVLGSLGEEVVRVEDVFNPWFLSVIVEKGASNGRFFAIIKRITDIVIGTVALILFSPLLFICCLIIKLVSRGECIYTQVRVGKDGRLFRMYKLRTMRTDAESETGPVWASDDDPRVLRACRWMRRSHIDELPQLINVLKGEMSLVGPRPERPEILEELEKTFPYINRRLSVLPGITGLAQIRNGYDKTIEHVKRKLEADFEYIATRNFRTDILILLATIPKFYDKSAN